MIFNSKGTGIVDHSYKLHMGINVRSEAKENQIKLFQSHQYLDKISQLSKRMMLEQMRGIFVDGRKSAMEA